MPSVRPILSRHSTRMPTCLAALGFLALGGLMMNAAAAAYVGEVRHHRIVIVNTEGTRILPPPGPAASPTPDLSVELTGDLRFREIRVYNPAALMAPLGGRIGRHISEYLAEHVVDALADAAERAALLHEPVTFSHMRPDGGIHRVTVIHPYSDCILAYVKRIS